LSIHRATVRIIGCDNGIGGFHENLVTFREPKLPVFLMGSRDAPQKCSSLVQSVQRQNLDPWRQIEKMAETLKPAQNHPLLVQLWQNRSKSKKIFDTPTVHEQGLTCTHGSMGKLSSWERSLRF